MPVLTGEEDVGLFAPVYATLPPVIPVPTATPTPQYTPAPAPVPTPTPNAYADLIAAWQASGLPIEEFKRQALAKAQANVDDVALYVNRLQNPTEPPEPEVVTMQRLGFIGGMPNENPLAAPGAAGFIPLGTSDADRAYAKAMGGIVTGEDVKGYADYEAMKQGYKQVATKEGQYWVKGRPSEPSLMDRVAGLAQNVLETKPAEAVTGALGWLQEKTEPLAGQWIASRRGNLSGVLPFAVPETAMGVARGPREEFTPAEQYQIEQAPWWKKPLEVGRAEYAHANPVDQLVASIATDPLTYVGPGGILKTRLIMRGMEATRAARAGAGWKAVGEAVLSAEKAKAVRLAAEAEVAARTAIRESLWIPGADGVVTDGRAFLTPEALAKEGTAEAKAALGLEGAPMFTAKGELWKPLTPEANASRLAKVEALADAEPVAPVPLDEALTLPRTQTLAYTYQASREASLRTGGAAAEAASERARAELTWALREQTQMAPYRVLIGEGGISAEDAIRAFRNGEGYYVGGFDGQRAQFHFYDEVDDVVNRMGGHEPLRIRPRPAAATPPQAMRQAELAAAEKALDAEAKTLPLDLKLARSLSLRSSEKTWNSLSRSERVAILQRAGGETALAARRWQRIDGATRNSVVREMRNIATGGARAAPEILTPTQAAASDALLNEAVAALKEQALIAKKARPKLAVQYHLERRARAKRLGEVAAQQLGEAGIAQKRMIAAGELAPGLKPYVGMSQEYKDAIINAIERSDALLDWEKYNVELGLQAMWNGEKFLQPVQLGYIERVFGPDLAKALAEAKLAGNAGLEFMGKAIGVPADVGRGMMTVLTAGDLSASLRQGVILSLTHPIEGFAKPFARQVRAVFSQDAYDLLKRAREAHPHYRLYTEGFGLRINELATEAGAYGKSPEQFRGPISRWIEKWVPGVKQSERAFVTFLNEQRFNVMDNWYTPYALKKEVPVGEAQGMARWINWASGEGPLPKGGAEALTALFWAPKLAMSRFAWPTAALWTSGAARRAILRDQFQFAGTVLGFLALAKASGAADVELDPRSTEFGKIRIGNTRIDITGGEQMLVRSMAQLITGQRKDIGGGIYDASRKAILARFLQSKLQPGVGLVFDIWQGHTFIGDELTNTGSTWKAQAFNRLVPLAVQDSVDAVREWGPKGLLVAPLAVIGLGTQTYSTPWSTLLDAEDKAAVDAGFKDFAAMKHEMGTNMALAKVMKDPEVVAAQNRADAYRKAHGGYRPLSEITAGFLAKQLEDDGKLTETHELTPLQWRQQHTINTGDQAVAVQTFINANPDLKKRFEKAEAKIGDPFALPEGADPDTVLAAYFKMMKPYKDELTGRIDSAGWDRLNEDEYRFRKQLTPEQITLLDSNLQTGKTTSLGPTKTDVERLYEADRETIEATGWWNIPDNSWKSVQTDPVKVAEQLTTKTNPVTPDDVKDLCATASKFATSDEYALYVYNKAFEKTGSRIAAAEALTSDPILSKVIGGLIGDARKGILDAQPELAPKVIGWGFQTDVVNALLARVLGAQGTTIPDVNQQLLAAGLAPIGSADDKKKAQESFAAGAATPPPIAEPPLASPAAGPVAGPPVEPAAETGGTSTSAAGVSSGGGGTATAGTAISVNPAVQPSGTKAKPEVGSYEAVMARLQGEAPYPDATVIATARAIAELGGVDLATAPAGLPAEQLKAKIATAGVSDRTWQTVGALGLQGKSNMLATFWTMLTAGQNSALAKTVMKNEDVLRVLDNLKTLGSATVEMYMRAFESMTTIFNEGVTKAQEAESKALQKAITAQEKKATSAAKSAAKKAEAAAEKEAAAQAERDRWARLAAELRGAPEF